MSLDKSEHYSSGAPFAMENSYGDTLIERNPPPPGGVSYLLCVLIKNPEEEDPSRKTTPKIDLGFPIFYVP